MHKSKPVMQFPCSFPLKVVGLNSKEFSGEVRRICRQHIGEDGFSCTERPSSGGKYLSLTVTFTAKSREQVDALYCELNDHDLVVMTL